MSYVDLLTVIKRNNLEHSVLEWAGFFRVLGARYKEGITLEDWITLVGTGVDKSVVLTFFRILENMDLLAYSEEKYTISDEYKLQRFFEVINEVLVNDLSLLYKKTEKLLWTIPSNYNVPRKIQSSFIHLNTWIHELIQTTQNEIIFLSPFFTEHGIDHIMVSLKALLTHNKDLKIRWITSDLNNNDANQKAFAKLSKEIRMIKENHSVNFYMARDARQGFLWFHAKLLLVDSNKGYMGSANFSKRAFNEQFELGVTLSKEQAQPLTVLIHYWIESGDFLDVTDKYQGT